MGVLYVNVGGSWVPVGGGTTDEVAIGPDDPVAANPNVELWYDTDAPSAGASLYANRNLLDNGQHSVNQRQVGNIVIGSATFLADRWMGYDTGVGTAYFYWSTAAAFGVFPPAGRPRPGNILAVQMNVAEAAAALSAGDWIYVRQGIEGQFLQHLNWGSADPRPLVLSVDVYSPIATTYVVELERLEATARSISKLLPVPAGFSTQVLTFPGDSTTPITNDNASRLSLNFWLTAGSSWTSGALNTSWNNRVDINRAGGISNAWQATVSQPVAFTNVQLEIGTTPTPYEVRPFDQELAKAMRYYEKSYPYATIPGSNAGGIGAAAANVFDGSVPTRLQMTGVDFRVTKRIAPLTYQAAWTLDGTLGYIAPYNAPATKLQVGTYGTHGDRQWAADYMTLNVSGATNTYYQFHWAGGCEI